MAQNQKKINFGELEKEIMEICWKVGQCCVRDVLEKLQKKRNIAYTTVMTVMTRLCNKGALKRKLNSSGAFIYTPTRDKRSFFAAASKKIISGLISDYGEIAVAQLMDIVENNDAKKLKELRRKLRRI